jgi:hypothetical protein
MGKLPTILQLLKLLHLRATKIYTLISQTVRYLQKLTEGFIPSRYFFLSPPFHFVSCVSDVVICLDARLPNLRQHHQRMETCFPYGIMMGRLHTKTSLQRPRTLTSDIVSEPVVMGASTEHNFQVGS